MRLQKVFAAKFDEMPVPNSAMRCPASPLAGGKGSGFVDYHRSFGVLKTRPNNDQREGKNQRFSIACLKINGCGSARLHRLTRALHIEDKRSCKQGDRIDVEGFGKGNLLDQSCCPNFSVEPGRADKAGGQNGLLLPVAQRRSNLVRVAVDIDEVLGSFLQPLNAFIAEKYLMHYNISEYYVYDFMKIWNCSQAEANYRVHAFFESKHFSSGILPICGAYQSLCRLSSCCNLVVVTSRQHVIRQRSLEWISRYYKGIFAEIHFGNHFALEGKSRPKSEICKLQVFLDLQVHVAKWCLCRARVSATLSLSHRSLGAQFLIDDNPRYAIECAREGIEVLLFDLDDSYPWSKTPDGPSHPLITRVYNWNEVELILMARIFSAV